MTRVEICASIFRIKKTILLTNIIIADEMSKDKICEIKNTMTMKSYKMFIEMRNDNNL